MSSMILDGVSPRARSTDPVTSVDAGRAARLHASQSAVLEFMRMSGGNWTQGELEVMVNDWSPSRIRSAVSELEALGLVEVVGGVVRKTRFGRKARVYRAVVPSE